MKRKYILLVVVLFLAGLVLVKNYPRQHHTIVLTQEEIQDALADMIPFQYPYALTLLLSFTNLEVGLNIAENRFDMHCDLTVEVRLSGEDPTPAQAEVVASLGYDDIRREFILTEVELEVCRHVEPSEELKQKIPYAAQEAVTKFFEGAPIYKIMSRDVQQQQNATFELKEWQMESDRLKAVLRKTGKINPDFNPVKQIDF